MLRPMRTIVVFWVLTAPWVAAQSRTRWEEELFTSERLFQEGNYGGAATLLQRLLAESDEFSPGDARRGIVLDNLGVVRQYLGDYGDAERLLLRSVSALETSL